MDVAAFYAAVRDRDTDAMALYFAQPSAMTAARETEALLTRADAPRFPSNGAMWTDMDVRYARARLSTPFSGRWFDDTRKSWFPPLGVITRCPAASAAWLFGSDSGLWHVLPRTIALLLPLCLQRAVERGHCDVIEAVLTSSAFLEGCTEAQQRVLLDAQSRRLLMRPPTSSAVVDALVAHGASVEAIDVWCASSDGNAYDDRTELAALAAVVQNGAWVVGCPRAFGAVESRGRIFSRQSFVRELVRLGADVRDMSWHRVVESLDTEAVRVLLRDGCVDVECRDDDRGRRYSSLLVATGSRASDWNASGETAALLLDYGANVHACDAHGRTALMLAAAGPHGASMGPRSNRAVARLLDHGADVHARDHDDRTPLHHACRAIRRSHLLECRLEAPMCRHATSTVSRRSRPSRRRERTTRNWIQ